MAAEVSSLATTLGAYKEEAEGESELVTRDLLGGGGGGDVDLELHVPAGWPSRIDLAAGKAASLEQRDPNPAPRRLHDLNLSPPSVVSLGLKLASASAVYQNVCTLEKVKSALQRESRLVATTGPASSPHSSSTTTTTSSSSSSSSASTKRRAPASPDEDGAAGSTMAVATCPVCLLYVLVSKADPRCPRCAAHVPVNDLKKKPRIDLNSSLPSH
ncbi:hypothetical protein B296_00036195 [Ensete ventricosum]|uniref:GIR1-like zinc ribbon domain-containing protein n=1 Tax=Ensete ventricosum TaxID=4639 RepID=A0A426XC42_ENSVE|nr:hypothetical protein B296_00036195 [Ensete ventricosum]